MGCQLPELAAMLNDNHASPFTSTVQTLAGARKWRVVNLPTLKQCARSLCSCRLQKTIEASSAQMHILYVPARRCTVLIRQLTQKHMDLKKGCSLALQICDEVHGPAVLCGISPPKGMQ